MINNFNIAPYPRTHLYVPLVDEAGELRPYAQVRVYRADGVTPYTGAIYRDRTSTMTWINPHVVAPALVDMYFPGPASIVLGIRWTPEGEEALSHVYELVPAGETVVRAAHQLYVRDPSDFSAVLSSDAQDGFWYPLKYPHEHETVAGGVRVGQTPLPVMQVGTFSATTAVGVRAGGAGGRTSLQRASAFGCDARVAGRDTVALGTQTFATESPTAPWADGAVGVGYQASAQGSGVALGPQSVATHGQVSVGRAATGTGIGAIALGPGTRAGQNGLALGKGAGTTSRGNPGSLGLGAGAQWGLPSNVSHTAVLLGAHDGSTQTTTYPNPAASQSESPWEEFTPVLGFAADTIQLQRHLNWVLENAGLTVSGDATIGGREAKLGFYGATPRLRTTIGDDEPWTGIPALDNLIYALRDLGLLGQRSIASLTYRAADLLGTYRTGDVVTTWAEHLGRDIARAVDPAAGPTFDDDDRDIEDRPALRFYNGFYCRRAAPLQQMRGSVLLPRLKHFVVVAEHNDDFGDREGLVNLANGDDDASLQVLTGSAYRQNRWSNTNVNHYERDGLDQSANFKAHPDHDHVHQVTATTSWPHATPILGGPRDRDNNGEVGDSWSGSVAEVVGLDSSWTVEKARSMAVGLGFLYGIKQDDRELEENARDFLITQHDPVSGTYIFWEDDYSDSYHGRVWGRVKSLPAPIRHRSYVDLQDADRIDYDGPLCGYWYEVPNPLDCEVIVLCRQGDWDDDDETDEVFGPFALNNAGTWTMGEHWARRGRKRCYVRRRDNHSVICRSWDRRDDCGEDIAVKIYSGTTLEGTVPLWGDKTFSARVRNNGPKVARIYDGATLIGSTDWQEQGLPRTEVYHPSDPVADPLVMGDRAYTYEVALAVMAFCQMGSWWDRRRARHILSALESVQAGNGSLVEWYLGTEADQGSGGNVDVNAMSWVILAVLRYQQVTGDNQFLPFAQRIGDYLKSRQIVSGAGAGSLRGFAHSTGSAPL